MQLSYNAKNQRNATQILIHGFIKPLNRGLAAHGGRKSSHLHLPLGFLLLFTETGGLPCFSFEPIRAPLPPSSSDGHPIYRQVRMLGIPEGAYSEA